MLAALKTGDRAAALEAALDAYFGPARRPRPAGLPPALAALFARLSPGLVRQNHLVLPTAGSRVFYVENQACNEWALGDDSDDPAVVRDGTVIESEPLSGFAIIVVLFEASMGALAWQAGGTMAPRRRAALVGLTEVPLRPWTWPSSSRFFVAPGIVAHTEGLDTEEEAWTFASAMTEERILEFGRANGIEWTGMEGADAG
jgi:hypothetical protein